MLSIGPQVLPASWPVNRKAFSIQDQPIKDFLDLAGERFGPKSVLFISFGSMFFPSLAPEYFEALIDVLLTIEPAFPFLIGLGGVNTQLTYGRTLAKIPAELSERISRSGRGFGV